MPQVCRWFLSGKVKDMSGWYVSIPHLASVIWARGFDACLPVCPVRLFPSTHTLLITFQMGVWGVNMTVQIDDTIAALWLSKCFHTHPNCELCLNFLAYLGIYAVLVPVYIDNLDPLTINVTLFVTQSVLDGWMCNICKKETYFYCAWAPAGQRGLFSFSAFWWQLKRF